MHGLKALVAGMSLMILICLGLLVYGFSQKMGTSGNSAEKAPAAATDISITLPAGGIVRDMALSEDGLALHVTTASQGYIYMINSDTGLLRRRIELKNGE